MPGLVQGLGGVRAALRGGPQLLALQRLGDRHAEHPVVRGDLAVGDLQQLRRHPEVAAIGCSSWWRTISAARSTAPPETQVCRPRAEGPAIDWSLSAGAM